MERQTNMRAWAVTLALLAGAPGLARAQYPGDPAGVRSGMYGTPSGMYANPYANPYINPFLNPYMMQGQNNLGAQNTLLYFMAARQMNGGLGSGRLSGTRPDPSARTASAASPAPSRRDGLTNDRTARYFNRGYRDKDGLSHYYGRPNAYYPQGR